MSQRKTVIIAIVALIVSVQISCGPKCPKVIASKSGDVMAYEDAMRANKFIDRRKSAMKAAEKGTQYDVERAMFTVSACELGTKLQLRIINLAQEGGAEYDDNIKRINETRCLMNKILDKKGKVMGFVGTGGHINKKDASKLQDESRYYQSLLGAVGTPSESQIVDAFEKGIPADKPKGKGGKAGKKAGAAKKVPSEDNEPTVESSEAAAPEGEGEADKEAEGETEDKPADDSPIDSF